MRDRDRWWWLLVLAGIVCWVASVAVPYQFMTTAPTPAENQFVTNDEYRGWIILSVVFGVVLLGCGVALMAMAVRARRRHRIRRVALQGDLSMMPLAAIRTEPAAAPNVAEQPLELFWRSSKVTGFFDILLFIVQGLGLLLPVGLIVFGLVLSLVEPSHPLNVWEIALHIAGILAAVTIIVGLIMAYVRIVPFLFGRPFGVTATEQGIDARTEFGTRIHMDWDEARLLEAVGADANAFRRFYLYAPGKRIGWAEYMARFGADYVSAGISSSEMTLRQVALLNLIVARTGLPPRTLAKSMAKTEPGSAAPTGIAAMQGSLLVPASEGKRSSTGITLLVIALIVVGIAVADFFVPITSVPWVNWGSTGSLVFAALILIIASVRELGAGNVVSAHAQPPSAAAPSLAAPGAMYVFSWRVPAFRRLGFIALGLCLGINLIPCAWVALQMFGLYLPGTHPQVIADAPTTFIVRVILTFTLALFGVMGLGVALGGMIAGTGRVRASEEGLATENGRLKRLIPWSSIQDISWGAGSRGQFSYLVKTDVPTIQASWPADSQAAHVIPPDGGALPIGAHELAALVAAQIGKPIRIREGR